MNIRSLPVSLILIASLGLLAAPEGNTQPAPAPQDPAPALQWQRSELYFGLGRPDGRSVTNGQWQAFLRDEVTARFPSGLTVVNTYGQWQDRQTGNISQEDSRVLILFHPGDTDSLGRIEDIRQIYMRRFAQQSVIHSIQPTAIRF